MKRYAKRAYRQVKKLSGNSKRPTKHQKSVNQVTIRSVNSIEYRMPLKRPYGTARGVTKGSTNFIVRFEATSDSGRHFGIGECQPRHRLTGDISINDAWNFLQVVAAYLPGKTLNLSTSVAAVQSVRNLMKELYELASSHSSEKNHAKPFRGTLLGIEVALLDLVSRSLRLSIAELLGKEREEVPVTVSTLSTQNSADEFENRVKKQARYPMTRVKGIGDISADLELMQLIHKANQSINRDKPIWIDFNEGYNTVDSFSLIREIAILIQEGALPNIVTLEQPIPGSSGDELSSLQSHADGLTTQSGTGDIRIMPDESIWDGQDLTTVFADGPCRAINIKTAKAGGLLPSLDLAREAIRINPDTNICIGGMVGTSDVTTWSLVNLAQALPRLDYLTAVPPGNVEQRITTPLTKFQSKTNTIHQNSLGRGLGAKLDYRSLEPYIKRESRFPAEKTTRDTDKQRSRNEPKGSLSALQRAVRDSENANNQLEGILAEHMKPGHWKGKTEARQKRTNELLRKVNPFQVSYMSLRRIERNGMSTGKGLSFRSKMVESSESRNLGVLRPTWLLDNKAAAYDFVDALKIPRPKSSNEVMRFADIEEQYPCVIKSTRSTGSRGCYLVYSPDHIVHVYDSKVLQSWSNLQAHAQQLMSPDSPGHTLKNNWIVEELILDPEGDDTPARDVKFFTFYGQVLLVLEMRRENGREYCFMNPDNTPADTGRNLKYFEGSGVTTNEIQLVEKISKEIPYPFARIDMLRGKDGLVFGEFTPRIGYFTDFNDHWDRKMGEAWATAESRLLEDLLQGKSFEAFLKATRMLQK